MPYTRPISGSRHRSKAAGALNVWIQAEKLMQIALLLPSAAFVGWILGAWIGGLLHQPWMGVAGIVFGGISGLVYVVRLALDTGKDPIFNEEPPSESPSGPEDKPDKGDAGTPS